MRSVSKYRSCQKVIIVIGKIKAGEMEMGEGREWGGRERPC